MSRGPSQLTAGPGGAPAAADRPRRAGRPAPAAVAVLLCLPGVAAFCVFLVLGLGLTRPSLLPPAVEVRLGAGLLLCVVTAVVTAVVSLALYWDRPDEAKSWPVVLNLAVNISGLLLVP